MLKQRGDTARYIEFSCVHTPDRLHCDKALCNVLVFVEYLIDILYHFNFNVTDISVIMNSPTLHWHLEHKDTNNCKETSGTNTRNGQVQMEDLGTL